MSKTPSIELEFSKKYNHEHAQQYLHKHQNGLAHRLSHWRDLQLAHQALQRAGNPSLVFDLPYGAGRFWPLLAKNPNRVILAADSSEAMLETALVSQHLIMTFSSWRVIVLVCLYKTGCIFLNVTTNYFNHIQQHLSILLR